MSSPRVMSRIYDNTTGALLRTCIVGVIALLCLYGYFLFATVSNGGEIERMQKMISEHASTLGDLEASYMTLKRNLSIQEAYALGFEDAEPIYISRGTNNSVALYTH